MCGKDIPWFAEGGAEVIAQSLYSTQDGVRDNYLRDVMKHKLEISQDDYNSQNVSLDQLEYSSQVNAYDVGAWFIAYLVHNEGVEVFLDGFYEELDELGFDAAFEKNFNKTKNEYLSEFVSRILNRHQGKAQGTNYAAEILDRQGIHQLNPNVAMMFSYKQKVRLDKRLS